MPGVISVSDFVRETREDFNSPTTSNFVTRIPQFRESITKLEEVRHTNFFLTRELVAMPLVMATRVLIAI
jgi:hypothetical protein